MVVSTLLHILMVVMMHSHSHVRTHAVIGINFFQFHGDIAFKRFSEWDSHVIDTLLTTCHFLQCLEQYCDTAFWTSIRNLISNHNISAW